MGSERRVLSLPGDRRGIFELSEGVALVHLDPEALGELLGGFAEAARVELDVGTMNGNHARAFQWLGDRER